MVITTILESKDLSSFSTGELMGSLLTHETRLHIIDESITNSFKNQFSFSRGRGRGHQGRGSSPSNPHSSGSHRQQNLNQNFQGHRQQNQNQNFQPQRGGGRRSNEKSSIQCYYCKKYGHYEYECRKKLLEKQDRRAIK
jgi:hypothetical protein